LPQGDLCSTTTSQMAQSWRHTYGLRVRIPPPSSKVT
jgi:hypothetical protein